MVRQAERWLAGFHTSWISLDLPRWLHLTSARPPGKPKLETRNRRSMESDNVFPREELRNSVHFTNANQILRARSCSIFMLTNIVLIMALLLSPISTFAQSSPPAKLQKVTALYGARSGASWPMWMAKDGGYYGRQGLDVELVFGVH